MGGLLLPAVVARPLNCKQRTLRLGSAALRPSAVLAPLEVKKRESTSTRHHPGSSRGLAGVLLSIMRVWEPRVQDNAATEQLLEQAAARGLEAAASNDAKQAAKKSAAAGKKAALPPPPPPAIDPFLRPVGVLELRYVRMLSNLCALTYFMDKLSPQTLRRRHGLRLVTSSRACELAPRQLQMSPLQAIVDGDATAADVPYVMATGEDAAAEEPDEAAVANSAAEAAALAAIAKVEPLVKPSADIVSSSLSAAAAAASTAAGTVASAAGTVASAAAPIAAPIASNISAFTATATNPLASVASQLQNAAAAGQATTAATLATVSAAVLSGRGPSAAQAQCVSPTEWFVADDEAASVRYFVIQGSDNMDHWRVNLTFDPVAFEDKGLGVKVHRGVYETAQILYDRFLPLVQEAVAAAPGARVAFAGHSLGGSLATLLMMMYLRRGVVRPENLAPVYTFGAPAIFCEGAAGGCVGGACALAGPGCSPGTPGGVLARLGLPETAVRNVVMHRDIVPRAFACDYSLVADLLRRVGESFREHRCLNGDRRVMFNFVGKVLLLQPAKDLKFVGAEGYHPMLPPAPGLFVVREPPAGINHHSMAHRDDLAVSNLPGAAAAAMEVPSKAPARPTVASSDEAVWQLMNNPHPLDILGDTGAYGDAGSISRYHNPDNYTRAIGGVLRARGAAAQGIVAAAKQRGVTFRPPHLGPAPPRADHGVEAASVPPPYPGGGKMHSPPATRPARHPMPAI